MNLIKVALQHLWFWFAWPRLAYGLGQLCFWLMGRQPRSGELDLSQVKRAVVVRLDKAGDVVMTTPLLRELRNNLPDTRIVLVVDPATYRLVEYCPYIDEILTYNWKVSRYWGPLHHLHALWFAYRSLWQHPFDLAILPLWGVDYYFATFVAYFSGAAWRVGYSETVLERKSQLNRGFDRLLTHALPDNSLKHEVEHNLDVLRLLGGTIQAEHLEISLSPADVAWAEQILLAHGCDAATQLIVLSPGAGAAKRQWPLDYFAELGTWLQTIAAVRLVIIGGPGEEAQLGAELQQRLGSNVINLAGQTTLRQTSALLQHCQLYIGGDSGPMHLAAAAGMAVIEISCHPQSGSPWHENSPKRFGPWKVPHLILQPEQAIAPCSEGCTAAQAHCILGVTVEQVKQAVQAQLAHQTTQTEVEP